MKNIIFCFVFILSSSVFGAKAEKDGILLGTAGSYSRAIAMNQAIADYIEAKNVQYLCRYLEVGYQVSYFTIDNLYFDKRYKRCDVTFTCYPRTLQQKQILSLQRACEKDPKPECFEKDFLDYIGAFENAEVKHVNKSACSNLYGDR